MLCVAVVCLYKNFGFVTVLLNALVFQIISTLRIGQGVQIDKFILLDENMFSIFRPRKKKKY